MGRKRKYPATVWVPVLSEGKLTKKEIEFLRELQIKAERKSNEHTQR